ncbi:MAG: hypothetical protein U1F43_12760 [Myxococcota bacterium]
MNVRPSIVLLLALLVAACGTPPEERLAQARLAAENKDLPLFLKYFTRRSAAFLRDLAANQARSKMQYLKDPLLVLPPGDLEEVNIDGKSAILKVKGKGKADEIRMFMENDEWSIDVFSLTRFWQPLREIGQ